MRMRFKGGNYALGQTRLHSIMETLLGTGFGFVVALLLNKYLLPMFGLHPSWGAATGITVIFTIVSLLNRYIVRRLFNWWHLVQLHRMDERWSTAAAEQIMRENTRTTAPGDREWEADGATRPGTGFRSWVKGGEPCVCGAIVSGACDGGCPYEGYRPLVPPLG